MNKEVLATVDDEIYLLVRRIEFKFKITFKDARDLVLKSIKKIYKKQLSQTCSKATEDDE